MKSAPEKRMRNGVSQGLALHYITENTGNTERAGQEGREREEDKGPLEDEDGDGVGVGVKRRESSMKRGQACLWTAKGRCPR